MTRKIFKKHRTFHPKHDLLQLSATMPTDDVNDHRIRPEMTGVESTTPRVLAVLAFAMERLVARNEGLVGESIGLMGKSLNVFSWGESPKHQHTQVFGEDIQVHQLQSLLLLVTSVMVASKMLDDVHYNNAFYARVGGVSNAELNRLELELLFMLDFGVVVSSRVFESYCLYLEKEMLWNGAGQRMERAMVPNSVDEVTEISMDDTQTSSSPPQMVD
ncbi:Cyclin-U1-1 [Vitis vinifera]|uniref:Cyclin-U1-1 n=1 Tax=Vitis vinifera TaxID=29760 RepID=A0A438CQL2_VITVI|nr:Cyclin-U1-1 [Vitis vinifera]